MRDDEAIAVPRYYFGKRSENGRYGKRSIASDLKLHDYYLARGSALMDLFSFMRISDDTTYRVHVRQSSVEVFCFGLESIDAKCEGVYTSVECLPQWLQEHLAVLMVASSEPPTVDIPEIGRRISERVFWVYAPKPDSEASASA